MTRSLHSLFEDQVKDTPDAQAVASTTGCLSYGDLEARANQLARCMEMHGVTAGTFVRIFLPRSPELITTILAVLKCGAAYVPLEPTYPAERIAFMVQDLSACLTLTNKKLRPRLPATAGKEAICIDDDDIEVQISTCSRDPRPVPASANLIAVVLYTSGSTGNPKGVLLTHRGLVNYLCWERVTYPLGPGDRVLQHLSISFDFSLLEIFTALASGACLVFPRSLLHFEGPYLVDLIQREQVTVMCASPSLLSLLIDVPGFGKCSSIHTVIVGGEVLSYQLQQRFFARSAARLINTYGPTETSIAVTHWECSREAADTVVPIGVPVAGARVLLLDDDRKPVPDGLEGEIYVGGPGVGAGYYNRPELNRERFIIDDSHTESGDRLYRTGDRAKRLPTGAYEYLGRFDNQVKLNGFRIELEEVECALRKCAGIRSCVATVTNSRRGNRKLVAYYVATGEGKCSKRTLGTELRSYLPHFMIPSVILEVEQLPLTPNGKVDRNNLPWVEEAVACTPDGPRTETERLISQIWMNVLGIPCPSVTADFFEIGGDSLACLEVSIRMEEIGIRFPLSLLIQASTIRDQAEVLDSGRATEEKVSIVHISTTGWEGMTLVLVPGFGGQLRPFANLTERLEGVRILGLTSPSDPPQASDDDAVRTVAKLHIVGLLKAVPEGKLVLAGYSNGGLIAIEIAHRLLKLGRSVGAVVLLDTLTPAMLQHVWERGLSVKDFVRALKRLNWTGRKGFVCEYASRIIPRIRSYRLRRKRVALADKTPKDALDLHDVRKKIYSFDRLYELVKQYKVPRYDGRVVLVRARYERMYGLEDLEVGWRDFVRDSLEIRNVPGGHSSMLHARHVEHVASIFRELLGAEAPMN